MIGRMARYGLVRIRFVIDDNREELVVFQIYDPSSNQWVGISEADGIAEGVVDKSIAGGFHLSGMHLVLAIPRNRLGKYRKYVVEWIDGLPPMTIMINEGVKIVHRRSNDKGDYYEVKWLWAAGPWALPGA